MAVLHKRVRRERRVGPIQAALLLTVIVAVLSINRATLVANPETPFGGAYPSVIRAVDPLGNWVVLCQARMDTNGDGRLTAEFGVHGQSTGDDLEVYLLAGKARTRLNWFIGSSPTGDHVAVVRGARTLLIDMRSGARTDLSALGAVLCKPDGTNTPLDSVAFSPDGHLVAYVRNERARLGQEVVLRDLVSEAESTLTAGAALISNVQFDLESTWVYADVTDEDTDANGRIELRRTLSNAQPTPCSRSPTSRTVFHIEGDNPSWMGARVGSRRLAVLPNRIGTFLGDLVLKAKSGEIVREGASGKRAPLLAPGSHVLVFGVKTRSILYARRVGATGVLSLLVDGRSQPVGEFPWAELDTSILKTTGSWVQILNRTATFVNLETGIVSEVPGTAIAKHGDVAVTRINNEARAWRLGSKKSFELGSIASSARRTRFHAGSYIAWGTRVVDLRNPALRLGTESQIVAICAAGLALVARSYEDGVSLGPFRWVRPSPIK